MTYPHLRVGTEFLWSLDSLHMTSMDGDVTDLVRGDYNIDIYKGGYQEIVYTVTARAGNTAPGGARCKRLCF